MAVIQELMRRKVVISSSSGAPKPKLTWQNGKVIESSSGFVIEKSKIWEYARWNPSDNLYDYVYLATPEEWEIEQD